MRLALLEQRLRNIRENDPSGVSNAVKRRQADQSVASPDIEECGAGKRLGRVKNPLSDRDETIGRQRALTLRACIAPSKDPLRPLI